LFAQKLSGTGGFPLQKNKKEETMTAELILSVLGWCTAINLGILMIWFLFFICSHDWLYRFHTKWFKLSEEKFDSIHYASMAFFKLSVFLLNLVPYLALRIVT